MIYISYRKKKKKKPTVTRICLDFEGSKKTRKFHMAPGEHSGRKPKWSGPACLLPRTILGQAPQEEQQSLCSDGAEPRIPASWWIAPPGSTGIPERPAGSHIFGSVPPPLGKGRADTPGEQSGRDQQCLGPGAHIQTPTRLRWAVRDASEPCSWHRQHFKHVGCLHFLELLQRISSLPPQFYLKHSALICLYPLPLCFSRHWPQIPLSSKLY